MGKFIIHRQLLNDVEYVNLVSVQKSPKDVIVRKNLTNVLSELFDKKQKTLYIIDKDILYNIYTKIENIKKVLCDELDVTVYYYNDFL